MNHAQEPLGTVWLWLGSPDVGTEHLLMVLTEDPEHGPTYRPLMAVTKPHAFQFTDLAQGAATALGVRAVLREYRVTRIGDTAEPDALAVVEPTP